MTVKLIGVILIIGCCGGYGMLLAAAYRKQVTLLHQLELLLEQMYGELEYRLTPVPELLRQCAAQTQRPLSSVFLSVAQQLENQSAQDAARGMRLALQQHRHLPPTVTEQLERVGHNLGRFDLSGQLRGLQQCMRECSRKRSQLEQNQKQLLRSYQTLGFCAGAALAILLL